MNLSPLFVAAIAAIVAFLGWRLTLGDFMLWRGGNPRLTPSAPREDKAKLHKANTNFGKEIANMTIALISVYVIARLVTRSTEISAALAIIATSIPQLLVRRRANQVQREQERAWPEAIDSIIAALHAGQSITESITSLRKYGPVKLRYLFDEIAARLEAGEPLAAALEQTAGSIRSTSANQLFVTLIHGKEFGGTEVTSTLRLLANFLRDQGAAVEEIETRFGWVKNSAFLGAFAPWLLLALLSMQQSTVDAFATDAGKLVLSIGIVATAVAFLWMERMAKLPNAVAPLALGAK